MKFHYKILISKPGIIVMMSLIILIQHWYYTTHPVERIKEKLRTVTEYVTREIPVIREIVKPGSIKEKLVYVEIPADIIEVVKIDTQFVAIDAIPKVNLMGVTIFDDYGMIKILVNGHIKTIGFEMAHEGRTKITAIDQTSIQVKQQRWGLFSALDIGYNSAEEVVLGADLLYINRFLFLRDLRIGPQVSFENRSGLRGNIGAHIGWQPFPQRNNLMIVPELYLFPDRFASIGLYVRLFRF